MICYVCRKEMMWAYCIPCVEAVRRELYQLRKERLMQDLGMKKVVDRDVTYHDILG